MTRLERPAPTSEEVWRLLQETDRLLHEAFRKIDQFCDRLGEFVADRVTPAVDRLLQARGLRVQRTMENLVCYDDDNQYRDQVDLLVITGDTPIAVECRSNLSVEAVDEHLERLPMFKDCWPEYGRYRLLGGVAGMVVPEDVARYADCQGLYVLAQSGDAVEIRNDGRFAAQEW